MQGDSVLVNRRAARYVPVSRSESNHAANLLTDAIGFHVLVTGVVVVGSAGVLEIDSQPASGDVVVLTSRRSARWLRSRPVVFDAAQVEAVFSKARRSDVWAPSGRRSGQRSGVS